MLQLTLTPNPQPKPRWSTVLGWTVWGSFHFFLFYSVFCFLKKFKKMATDLLNFAFDSFVLPLFSSASSFPSTPWSLLLLCGTIFLAVELYRWLVEQIRMAKLAAVYEYLDAHAFSQALKLCDQALKKKTNEEDMFKAIRALCLVHLERRAESLERCEELTGIRNPQVLTTLNMVYTKLRRPERMLERYEEASKDGVNEALFTAWFFALMRVSEWAKMQQVALRLFKNCPHAPRYLEWSVFCMLMQGGRACVLAHGMLPKLATVAEPNRDTKLVLGGDAETPMRVHRERRLLEAACLAQPEPLKAIEALDGVLIGDTSELTAQLYAATGDHVKASEVLQPFDSFEKVFVAHELGCDIDVDKLPTRIRIWLRALRKEPEAVKEYLQEFGHEPDAFFHIRPFLTKESELLSLAGEDDWRLVNLCRAYYSVGKTFDAAALVERVQNSARADVIRLFAAVMHADKGEYAEALALLENQSPAEVEGRRSLTLEFLIHGWNKDGDALSRVFDTLEIKNVLYSSRFTALAIQWLLETKELAKVEKISKSARAHVEDNMREIDEGIQLIMERGPLDRVPEMVAFRRDQMCSLAHVNADTALGLIHLHRHPDDLASLESLVSLDHDILDTDCGGLLQEICPPSGRLRRRNLDAIWSIPSPRETFEQCSIHPLMRPTLLATVQTRMDELAFLRQLQRTLATEIEKNPSGRRSFDAPLAIAREDYEAAAAVFADLSTTLSAEADWEQSLSQTFDVCVLCWAAKVLPKSKKRQSPLFAARAALKQALNHADSETHPRPCVKELNFRP
eukprot:GEMP01011331.1.p1 GENE.GEMP01011331.1~~GEMP01011331.1.p1  ORF type:complete len:795 (+),score=189.28 GEMP01011331.1:313-2697(+)